MAQNAKDIQLRDLKDLTNELRETNRLLKKMLEESQKREEELKQERDNLKGQIDYLTKKLFGSSSEKGIGQIPGQMGLFNEVEASADPSLEEADAKDATEENQEDVSKKGPRKKRSTDKERYKGVPVEKRYLEPSEGTPVCEECGSLMEKIGEEFVRRELRITPARAKVIEYYSVNYACKQCMDDAVSPTIVKGKDGKAHMMYGMASASTVAWIIYNGLIN